jgi:hypothetical protein
LLSCLEFVRHILKGLSAFFKRVVGILPWQVCLLFCLWLVSLFTAFCYDLTHQQGIPKKEAITWVDYTALMIMRELSDIFPLMCRRCRLLSSSLWRQSTSTPSVLCAMKDGKSSANNFLLASSSLPNCRPLSYSVSFQFST